LNENTKKAHFVKQNGMDKSPMAKNLLKVAKAGEWRYKGKTMKQMNKNVIFGFRIFVLTFRN